MYVFGGGSKCDDMSSRGRHFDCISVSKYKDLKKRTEKERKTFFVLFLIVSLTCNQYFVDKMLIFKFDFTSIFLVESDYFLSSLPCLSLVE